MGVMRNMIGFVTEDTVPPDFDPNKVTSGAIGFLFIALLAVAVVILCIFLVRTLRRINYREEARAAIAAELAAQQAAAGTGSSAGDRAAQTQRAAPDELPDSEEQRG